MEYTDDTGQLESVVPPRGQGQGPPSTNPYATRYEYSPTTGGNLVKIDRPSPLGDETFTYDVLSRVKTRTDGQGHVQTYDYDKMDHIQRIGYKNSAAGAEVSSLQYDYDNNGNMVCRGENGDCEDPGLVETDYQYDRLNRLKFVGAAEDAAGGAYDWASEHKRGIMTGLHATYKVLSYGAVGTACAAGAVYTTGAALAFCAGAIAQATAGDLYVEPRAFKGSYLE